MRQNLALLVTVAIVIGLLVLLNAASYVREEPKPDTEWTPNRSSYNSGPTGTRALYDFLSESGHKVMRWREAPSDLLTTGGAQAQTFVIVGPTLTAFQPAETRSLMRWVSRGGRLVVIDRGPLARLLHGSNDWSISTSVQQHPSPGSSADNPEDLTAGVSPAHAVQPTLLTRDVGSVLPSRFAGAIELSFAEDQEADSAKQTGTESEDKAGEEDDTDPQDAGGSEAPSPPPIRPPPERNAQGNGVAGPGPSPEPSSPAPVVHVGDDKSALLVDYRYGSGRVVFLSDPFVVANNGISRADNLQLAVNVIAGAGGLAVFDEFHQGHAASHNPMTAYFSGTPVLWMLAQASLIVLAIIWTRGRRLARPLPLAQVDRRSGLEFVASMAELQQRARAYDLAIENIYSRTRRALVRYSGMDNFSPRAEVAARVAARSGLNGEGLESLMRECEEAINGVPIDSRRSLDLARRLRGVERALGIVARSREVRQAAESL
jgi:hypothetical protein